MTERAKLTVEEQEALISLVQEVEHKKWLAETSRYSGGRAAQATIARRELQAAALRRLIRENQ